MARRSKTCPMMSESLSTADLARRPFGDVDQMNDELRHNARVDVAGGDEVDVYMLDDFAYHAHPGKVEVIWQAPRGRLHLLPGEEDHQCPRTKLPQ